MQAHELFRYFRMPELVDFRQYVRTLPTNTLMGFGAFAALTTFWYATRPKALKPPCDLSMQSVEVAGSGGARRSALLDSDEPLVYFYEDVTTLYEGFQRGIQVSNNGPCLGSRKPDQPYEWLSYKQVAEMSECLGSALIQKGFTATPDQFIGIFAQNRPEWVIIEQGCFAYSMVIVPLYDTLGNEAVTYIVNKAELSLVFVDKPEKAELLLEGVENKLTPSLKIIVLMDAYGSELVERGQKCGVEIISLKAMEDLGRANRRKPKPPAPEDLAVVCFTSGTTGNPKGALITHRNIVSDCSAFVKATENSVNPCPDDTLISFLPLAHMFERVVEKVLPLNASDTHISFLPLAHMYEQLMKCVMLCHGAKIGFFQGDIRLLMDDLKVLQPTVFPVVPRLLNRMFDRIFGQANTTLKRWLLDFASKRKEAELRSGIIRNNSLWDRLIFHKVQSSLGGRVRLMVTGAAPVSATVLTFLRAALGCQFYEGYGQTECTAGCCLSMPGDWTAGHVGAPMPCNLIKLVDVEEMNYMAAEGEGEVCVKGPNVFQGYLKDPAKTAEALDKDGWLHTGDIGKWLPNGTLKIIDRKKHIFKLAQGEYIAPEKIENIYIRSEAIAQVFVHGESLQAFLIAIVVPDVETLRPWAQKRGFDGSFEELCRNKDVKKAILEDMVRLGKDSGLKPFEQVKGIALHPELFSIDNGLLTPTMKAKRPELRNYFRSQIDELYSTIKV
ncbi:long-chain-fatty-acid--CoA ligase 1 isoform X2 [Papio anubis]|uniref:Long-chain-fatty-acid--CoA ligase n=3 Tax=Papio anubis TaxID=9555 RepID=A0A2I3MGZ5_PAPAN|nr:long-chain-fatty-acid--CoA ligase 1 isoform X2 [Papio anubis]XP_031519987.1 long-chain-fatty-acid--CoA ligase 1 isoform X2 [Papio anubis]XP_031519988.1 long-chain-fatty-acid--CoA ligase 1 isoform X2 [Papio anubis]XP_031519989.1 long-chain-fatty-acid--CoA ligase 1 isoform X2 [Papio anubis]XP_031519990.1 long-chain-fatty-acid--CoA ligase 1 isoform X2 [Papio anubis]XP_031519991.1 long-chain-fatty-acid--CoA ligase 1 isoform X2 [Papio anubis]XP_031519992.1 long-chain-fatty-acid--CoA ligase 1 is